MAQNTYLYGAGTVTIVQNDATITFSSAALLAQATEGDALRFGATDIAALAAGDWPIDSITDATHCEVTHAVTLASGTYNVVLVKDALDRHDPDFLNTRIEALLDQIGGAMDFEGNDRLLHLAKVGTADFAGLLLQTDRLTTPADVARLGLLATNEVKLQMWASAQWNDVFRTVALQIQMPNAAGLSVTGPVAIGAAAVGAGVHLDLQKDSAVAALFDTRAWAAGRGGTLLLQGYDNHSTPERTTWAALQGVGTDGTQGSEDGDLDVYTMRAGALTKAASFKNTGGLVFTGNAALDATAAGTFTIQGTATGPIHLVRHTGVGIATPENYLTGAKLLVVGSVTPGEVGQFGIVGNQSSDAGVADLSFHNEAIGAVDLRRIAIIRAARSGANNSGSLGFYTWSAGSGDLRMLIAPAGVVSILAATASVSIGTGALTVVGGAGFGGAVYVGGALKVEGNVGFYNTAPVAKPTGVAVTAGGIHAALVTLGLIAA